MKKALSKRGVAAIICLAVILLSTYLGAGSSLNEKRTSVEDIFTDGENGNGMGIQYDLDRRTDDAYNLITVAGRYMDKNCSEITAVSEARSALKNASSPSEKCVADAELAYAVMTLYGSLGSCDLSSTDAKYRESLYSDFTSAAETIGHSTYNVAVEEFNRIISEVPASFFAKICGVEKLEKYEK